MESWLGLRFAEIALYFDLLRECYEAFVIYSFYQLLVTYLGGERNLVEILAAKPEKPHVFPFCCLPAWRMSDRFQIHLNPEERERMQQALEESLHLQATRAAAAANANARSGSSASGTQMVSLVRAGGGAGDAGAESKESGHSAPDFSSAASSPDLLRGPHSEPIERPLFQSPSAGGAPLGRSPLPPIPSFYLSPYSQLTHSDFLTHTQLGTLQCRCTTNKSSSGNAGRRR